MKEERKRKEKERREKRNKRKERKEERKRKISSVHPILLQFLWNHLFVNSTLPSKQSDRHRM
jgi:hypothetical protein